MRDSDETRNVSFILIGGPASTQLAAIVEAVLAPLGTVRLVSEREARSTPPDASHLVTLVDSGAVDDVPSLVSWLTSQHHAAPVAVITASPTWRRAREASRAGAADYLPTTLPPEQWRQRIHRLLDLGSSHRAGGGQS